MVCCIISSSGLVCFIEMSTVSLTLIPCRWTRSKNNSLSAYRLQKVRWSYVPTKLNHNMSRIWLCNKKKLNKISDDKFYSICTHKINHTVWINQTQGEYMRTLISTMKMGGVFAKAEVVNQLHIRISWAHSTSHCSSKKEVHKKK